jgi:hypothetical protein
MSQETSASCRHTAEHDLETVAAQDRTGKALGVAPMGFSTLGKYASSGLSFTYPPPLPLGSHSSNGMGSRRPPPERHKETETAADK